MAFLTARSWSLRTASTRPSLSRARAPTGRRTPPSSARCSRARTPPPPSRRRPRRRRARGRGGPRRRTPFPRGGAGPPHPRRLPRAAAVSDVAAVVIWTPGDPDPGPCLESLAPQVDELVLVANPGGNPEVAGAKVVRNAETKGFGANINAGVATTSAPFVAASNPDVLVEPGAIATLAAFAESHPRCGIA